MSSKYNCCDQSFQDAVNVMLAVCHVMVHLPAQGWSTYTHFVDQVVLLLMHAVEYRRLIGTNETIAQP